MSVRPPSHAWERRRGGREDVARTGSWEIYRGTYMKTATVIFIALSALGISACGQTKNVGPSKNAWLYEGWACAPDQRTHAKGLSPADDCKELPRDHLYVTFRARPSEKGPHQNSIGYKMSTCRENARLELAVSDMNNVLRQYIRKNPRLHPGCRWQEIPEFNPCGRRFGAVINSACCSIRGIGMYECCSINEKTGRCAEQGEAEDWNECLCIAYTKYPGGNKYAESMCRDVTPAARP